MSADYEYCENSVIINIKSPFWFLLIVLFFHAFENLANIGGDYDGDSDDDDDNNVDEQFMVSFDRGVGVGGSSFHIPSPACEISIQRRDQSGK
ncbi:hypothetical protein VNO77_06764 [Canavalia gladiata]|uniref:Transmembrane protein n=1 Tax=Canavalia gladiata TaxID=3824 RepID=A0AAN9QVS9_CANGL